ncbi:hypothetical protein MKY04_18080 [Lysinibacillus telephonicus]|uniref:hypothetical protein n=1 Tax=Lysinibacillus telephonicus TaxID=1714840 RepID=UPI0031FC5DE6
MNSEIEIRKSLVPPSIELLFNNEQLELIKTLCLLYAFYLKSNRKFNKISDIVFYYSLINFDLIRIFDGNKNNTIKLERNLPFRFQTKINNILLELSNLNYVVVKGELSYKINEISVKLTSEGIDFVNEINIPFITELIEKYSFAINNIESTSANKNTIVGGVL